MYGKVIMMGFTMVTERIFVVLLFYLNFLTVIHQKLNTLKLI